MQKHILPIIVTLGILIFISCGGNSNKKKTVDGKIVYSGADGKKYIAHENANWLNTWSTNNIVVVHFAGEPENLHPSNASSEPRFIINQYTQKFIYRYGLENLNIIPDLVIDYAKISADKLQYSFELRKEAKWDDGSSITAKDILFTFKILKHPFTNNPQSKSYLQNLKNIVLDETNPLKFTFVMDKEYIQNEDFMTDYPVLQQAYFDKNKIMDKCSFEDISLQKPTITTNKEIENFIKEYNDAKYGNDVNFLTGAGPYKVEKWDRGQSITLIKKQNYWASSSNKMDDKAYPDKIIFKINTDPNSTLLEFKSQTMDVSTSISVSKMLELQADSMFNENYYSNFISTFNYTFVAFNTQPDGVKHKKIFTDKNVRRAFALLTPVNQIIQVVFKGVPERISSIVSSMKKEYNADLKLLPYDVEQAKKILDNAGWKDTDADGLRDKVIDGKKTQLMVDLNFMNNMVEWKDMAQMMAESYAKAGIKLNLNPMDVPVAIGKARMQDFDMHMAVWGGNSAADDFSQIWKTESWKNHGDNYTGFGNATTDALIDSCRFIVDEKIRVPLVKRFQKIVYDEQPYILLLANTRRVIIHKRFANANVYLQKPHVALNHLQLLKQ